MKTSFYFARFGLLFLVFYYFTSCQSSTDATKKIKYVAYIGRFTDSKEPNVDKSKFDKLHEHTLKKYLSELDFPYTELQLKTFDCKRDGRISDSIYKEIAKDSNIVFVIDNTWGEHINVCAETIRQLKIPVISINADKNGLDFGSQTIFTGNSDLLPLDVNAFITKVCKNKEVNFISESDYPLHAVFLKSFNAQGIKVKNQVLINAKSYTYEDSMAFYHSIKTLFENSKEEGTLTILNVHNTIGNKLIPFLDQHFSNIQLLGHSYIVNTENLKGFGKKSKNDLILISNPTDAISKKLLQDIDTMKLEVPELFQNSNHAMFVERCLDAVSIIKRYKSIYPNQAISRNSFREFLVNLKSSEFTENNEVFEVDSSNSIIPEIYFTRYAKGQLNSYPLQLNLEREVIPNLFFGIEIVDIYNIDVNTNSFSSDFYYWIKLDSTKRDVEKYIVFQNMKQTGSSKELIFEKIDGTTIYKLYKVSGLFYVNYNLDRFPFDEQELSITAEVLNPSNILRVSFDQESIEVDSTIMDKFKISEWKKNRFYVTVENVISRGLHGDPDIDAQKLSVFKTISFRLQVERKILAPLLEIMLPLIMIGIVSISLLMLRNVTFENLGEVSIGVFITIVAFSISYADSTPQTDNLTRADYLFWLTFMVVLVSFMIVIVINSIYKFEKVINMNLRKMGFVILFIYLLGVFYALLA